MTLTTLFDGERDSRELTDGTYVIGRGVFCRIRFDAPEVNERHAILTVRNGEVILEDLHSTNGTFVNGEAIDRAVRLDGSKVVQIGTAMMRVSEEEAEESKSNKGMGKVPLFTSILHLHLLPRPSTLSATFVATSRRRSSASS